MSQSLIALLYSDIPAKFAWGLHSNIYSIFVAHVANHFADLSGSCVESMIEYGYILWVLWTEF